MLFVLWSNAKHDIKLHWIWWIGTIQCSICTLQMGSRRRRPPSRLRVVSVGPSPYTDIVICVKNSGDSSKVSVSSAHQIVRWGVSYHYRTVTEYCTSIFADTLQACTAMALVPFHKLAPSIMLFVSLHYKRARYIGLWECTVQESVAFLLYKDSWRAYEIGILLLS